MNRKIMPIMLFMIEVVMYYFICLYFHMDIDLIVGSGTLYFLFLFIYGHYSLNTCLIWNEIQQLVKSSFCFYIALLVLVPQSTGYERKMHLITQKNIETVGSSTESAGSASTFCVSQTVSEMFSSPNRYHDIRYYKIRY